MKLLFLDVQTTGMHPSTGNLLELAWESPLGARSFLLRLPEDEGIPAKVTEITGIRNDDLASAVPPEEALAALAADLAALGSDAVVVAHYAQFERAFLPALEARVLCTYQLARRLLPEAPSRNIRALVGYFGLETAHVRRAHEHARATRLIWEKLAPLLEEKGLRDFEALEKWLRTTKAAKAAKIEYRVDRLLRLGLPDKPGIYRMLARDGKVLYVGKATSLRDRVNSYFRGKRGPGPKKREMLAQVYDIQVTECGSALEAALLESEEIKRLDPPYNVSLKTGNRNLRFFSRDFESVSAEQDALHPLGPFGRHNSFESLAEWRKGTLAGEPAQIFHDEVDAETLRAGEALFLARHGLSSLPSVRSLLALGLRLARELEALELDEEDTEDEEEAGEEEAPLTPEEAADRYEGLVLRAAWEYRRAKRLTSLLDCRVILGDGERTLEVSGGLVGGTRKVSKDAPWAGLGIADYDRMSVLLTEVVRHGYPVESPPSP